MKNATCDLLQLPQAMAHGCCVSLQGLGWGAELCPLGAVLGCAQQPRVLIPMQVSFWNSILSILESLGCLVAEGGWWGAHIEGGVQLAWGASWSSAGGACWGASVQLVSAAGGTPEHL